MKKILALCISAVMALSFAGCGSPAASESRSDTSAVSSENISHEGNIYDLASYENDDVFDFIKLDISDRLDAVCETYQFTFLSDDYQIKGYISVPISAIEVQKPCKCLVFCRGGNSNLGALDKTDTAMRSASLGRIVVACELRGCGGSEGRDEFGGDEVHDVLKLIDLCDKQFPFADTDDLCVEGESRGGMMTYMAARADKRVKKIVVCSGITDLFQDYEERPDTQDLLIGCIGGTPEELPDEYEKRSAYYWADELTIPVMIIHSKGDQRVSFDQAEKMYEKLKSITDCTFVTYDDDLHALHEEDIPKIAEWIDNT